MNCEDFKGLLADALGNELQPQDRPAFDEHLATCDRCRCDYESSREALNAMRTLPGPQRVSVRREGDRLVIDEGDRPALIPPADGRATHPPRWTRSSLFRYAASVLIAFTAGYLAHAMAKPPLPDLGQSTLTEKGPELRPPPSHRTVKGALVSAYTRSPARSDLANAFIAMAKPGP
ncbi:MAG: zf-HC2 domain-containing protein [Phycisphaerae bacterium]